MENGTFFLTWVTSVMKKLRIAIQGIRGSNHHMVATEYFGGDIELVESLSFHSLVDALIGSHHHLALRDHAERAAQRLPGGP